MVLEDHQYQGLSVWEEVWEESEDNTDAVAVVESYEFCHSPGTIDEFNGLLCGLSPAFELGSYAVSAPTPPLPPLCNHISHMVAKNVDRRDLPDGVIAIPLRRWHVLKVVVVYFAGIRHELGKYAMCGKAFADNTRQCHALNPVGDCLADKEKQVISDLIHPASRTASFETEEGNCHFNKLNLTGHNNDLDQDENMEMVTTESTAVKPSKPDFHMGFDKTYSIHGLAYQRMEFCHNEKGPASSLGESFSDTVCGSGDVNNAFALNRHHALENDIRDDKGLPNLGNGKGKKIPQSKLGKRKGLTLEDIQVSRAQGMKLKDAAAELEVSPSTLKRHCRLLKIKNWRENKGNSHCPKQPKDSLKHSKETTRTAHNRASEDSGASPGSRIFNIKATHRNSERTIIFDFASTSTIDRLKEEVSQRLSMETSRFKIQYWDEEGDWVEMVLAEDLQQCLCLSSSLGKERIRLQILDL